MFTNFHSKYWAAALACAGAAGSMESLSRSLGNAKVDLNPHQVDAALFALRSPLAKGVILADEVGLGKTIEAGLVMLQRWTERRRRMLVITPAILRAQWQQELGEKFGLPALILDGQTYRSARKSGSEKPFQPADQIVICSYHFAAANASEIQAIPWDLVVFDEAHRLRNVFKSSSKIAATVAAATAGAPKILMTATPLQNSLFELYGLVSVIDPRVFGDEFSFREQFVKNGQEAARNEQLRQRLAPVCTRTLRQQVLEYIRFTQRTPLTQDFTPSDEEQRLYDAVTAYLQREQLLALPAGQRSLLTLVLRKLLASSSFAIAGTLRELIGRLEAMQTGAANGAAGPLPGDFEGGAALAEEWTAPGEAPDAPAAPPTTAASLQRELADLRSYLALAEGIQNNAKGEALIGALELGLRQAQALGAARKAVIFTESRRTQAYLHRLLGEAGYAGQIVLLNASNADPESKAIYQAWRRRHANASGSRAADMKSAIAEEFRDRTTLLIATESAAEGINLQFCSLVVNYDLPWNPQRIEQRIGRCHRYGQRHDVVVLNFLNRRNAADQRVFQLLSEKFRLFQGVFGASDEVLGAIESGVDLEKRIAAVYQHCRTPEEIEAAFDRLQAELDGQIQARLSETRRALLENFDAEVHERLRAHNDQALTVLSERHRWLAGLVRHELTDQAAFLDAGRFRVRGNGSPETVHNLDWRDAEARGEAFFRQEDPLAQSLIARAAARELPPGAVRFSYRRFGQSVALLRDIIGHSGWLRVARLAVQSLQAEEFILLAGICDNGATLHEDHWKKLLLLPGESMALSTPAPELALTAALDAGAAARLQQVAAGNARHFDEQVLKLDRWAEDLKLGLETQIRQLDRDIRDARRAGLAAAALERKLEAQRQVRELEARRHQKRRELFASQDKIDAGRDQLIAGIEAQLARTWTVEPLLTLRWALDE